MKLQLVSVALVCCLCSQAQEVSNNSISISSRIMWTHAEALYYTLGSPKHSSSTTKNYGLDVNYSTKLYNHFHLTMGAGYFKQTFNLLRPFLFNDPYTNLLYHTDKYSYDNLDLLAGISYNKNINRNNVVKTGITYNHIQSLRQNYKVAFLSDMSQTNRRWSPLADIINLNVGLERYFSKRVSIQVDGVMSLFTKWQNDKMFFKYESSDDSQRAALNKSSVGTSFSCCYHF